MLIFQAGPATHAEVKNSLRLFGKYVIPHFKAKEHQSRVLLQPRRRRTSNSATRDARSTGSLPPRIPGQPLDVVGYCRANTSKQICPGLDIEISVSLIAHYLPDLDNY